MKYIKFIKIRRQHQSELVTDGQDQTREWVLEKCDQITLKINTIHSYQEETIKIKNAWKSYHNLKRK